MATNKSPTFRRSSIASSEYSSATSEISESNLATFDRFHDALNNNDEESRGDDDNHPQRPSEPGIRRAKMRSAGRSLSGNMLHLHRVVAQEQSLQYEELQQHGSEDILSILGEADECSIRSSSNRPLARGRRASLTDANLSNRLDYRRSPSFHQKNTGNNSNSNSHHHSKPSRGKSKRGRRKSFFGVLGSSKRSMTLNEEDVGKKKRNSYQRKLPGIRRASMGSISMDSSHSSVNSFYMGCSNSSIFSDSVNAPDSSVFSVLLDDPTSSISGEVDEGSVRSNNKEGRPFASGRRASLTDLNLSNHTSNHSNGRGFYTDRKKFAATHKKNKQRNADNKEIQTKPFRAKTPNKSRRNSLFGGYLGSSKRCMANEEDDRSEKSNRRASMGSAPHSRRHKSYEASHDTPHDYPEKGYRNSKSSGRRKMLPNRSKSSDFLRSHKRGQAGNDNMKLGTYHRPKHPSSDERRRASSSNAPLSSSEHQAQQQALQQEYQEKYTRGILYRTSSDAMIQSKHSGLRHVSYDADGKVTSTFYNIPTSEQDKIPNNALGAPTNDEGVSAQEFVSHSTKVGKMTAAPHTLQERIKSGRVLRSKEDMTLHQGVYLEKIEADVLDKIDGLPDSFSAGKSSLKSSKQEQFTNLAAGMTTSLSFQQQVGHRTTRRNSYIPTKMYSSEEFIVSEEFAFSDGEKDFSDRNKKLHESTIQRPCDQVLLSTDNTDVAESLKSPGESSKMNKDNRNEFDNVYHDPTNVARSLRRTRSSMSSRSSMTKTISNRRYNERRLTNESASPHLQGQCNDGKLVNVPVSSYTNDQQIAQNEVGNIEDQKGLTGEKSENDEDKGSPDRISQNDADQAVLAAAEGLDCIEGEDYYDYMKLNTTHQAILIAKGDWGCGLSEELSDIPSRERNAHLEQNLQQPKYELEQLPEHEVNDSGYDSENQYRRSSKEAQPRSMASMEFINMATLSNAKEALGLFLPNFVPASGCTNASDFIVRCFVARMKLGMLVTKHNRNRFVNSHERVLFIRPDKFHLTWVPNEDEIPISRDSIRSITGRSKARKISIMDLSKCTEVRHAWGKDPRHPKYTGTATLRAKCKENRVKQSFSLIFPERTLDFTTGSYDQCKLLMDGFSALCFRLQMAKLEAMNTSKSSLYTDVNSHISNDQLDLLSETVSLTGTNVTAPWGY